VCEALAPLVVQLRNLDEAIARLERTIAKLAQKDETARRLMTIPGFGPIPASAMAATIQDTSRFAGPREFAAYLGLTPKQNSSGGKQKLGRISKMGNRNLRKLLVVSAHAVLFHRKSHTDPLRMWGRKLTEKKPFAQFGPTRSPNNDIDASSTCVLFLLLPFGRAIFLTEGFQATIRLPEPPVIYGDHRYSATIGWKSRLRVLEPTSARFASEPPPLSAHLRLSGERDRKWISSALAMIYALVPTWCRHGAEPHGYVVSQAIEIIGWRGRIRTSGWRNQNPLAKPSWRGRRAAPLLDLLLRTSGPARLGLLRSRVTAATDGFSAPCALRPLCRRPSTLL
jgi:hypothetical protein